MSSTLDRLWERFALITGTGFGLGKAPVAPGTFGSLLGPLMVWGLQSAALPIWGETLVVGVIVLLGIAICQRAAQSMGKHDPGSVVWDEIAAFPLVLCTTPVTVITGVIGFGWFRLFDILKPWPVRRAEALPGGFGIMADDQVAAVYACAATWGSIKLLGDAAYQF